MILKQTEVEYRYERKFQMDLPRWQVEQIVRRNRAAFSPIYWPRWINNIYLDTPGFSNYQDSLDGASDGRVKMRIRWYEEFETLVEKPVLEFKIKQGTVNRKVTYPLAPMDFAEGINRKRIQASLRQANLPRSLMTELLKFDLALANRYYRSYFLSADSAFRITVDSDQTYMRMSSRRNLLLARWRENSSAVLELKYAPELDGQAAEISQQFPFRLSRNSKYASGVERMVQG